MMKYVILAVTIVSSLVASTAQADHRRGGSRGGFGGIGIGGSGFQLNIGRGGYGYGQGYGGYGYGWVCPEILAVLSFSGVAS